MSILFQLFILKIECTYVVLVTDIETMKKIMPKCEQELSTSPEPVTHEDVDVTPSYLIHNPDLIKCEYLVFHY